MPERYFVESSLLVRCAGGTDLFAVFFDQVFGCHLGVASQAIRHVGILHSAALFGAVDAHFFAIDYFDRAGIYVALAHCTWHFG